jgi:hypothetical protein
VVLPEFIDSVYAAGAGGHTGAGGRSACGRVAAGDPLFIITEDGTRQHIAHLEHYLVAPSEGARKILSPTWSPDGEWITFVSMSESGAPDLYILRPDGSGLRRIGRISDRGAAMLPRWVRME